MKLRRAASGLAVVGLLATGCSDPGEVVPLPTSPTTQSPTTLVPTNPEPSPTPTATPSPTPTTAPPTSSATAPPATNPPASPTPTASEDWTVPNPPTDEYAHRVLQELFNIENEATVIAIEDVKAHGEVVRVDEIVAVFDSTNVGPGGPFAGALIGLDESTLPLLVDPPEPYAVSDVELLSSNAGCLQIDTTLDTNPTTVDGVVTSASYRLERDLEANPSGWVFELSQMGEERTAPCA